MDDILPPQGQFITKHGQNGFSELSKFEKNAILRYNIYRKREKEVIKVGV